MKVLKARQLGGVVEGEPPLVTVQTSMEELFESGPDLDQEEAHKVKALIRRDIAIRLREKTFTCGNFG